MDVQKISAQSPPFMILTGEELQAMGDIGPAELIEGRLVYMTPTKPKHGKYEFRIAKILGEFVDQNNLGEVQVGEIGIYTHRNPDTVRATDVLFISHERLARATPDSFLDVAPDLVVEILSPDDRWSEVKKKLRDYFEAGVPLVWIVDPEEKTLSAYRSLTEVLEFGEKDVVNAQDILPGFSLPVAMLFI
jgi:Uma2 family endonuclease